MTHTIEEGGAFERACSGFLKTGAAVLYQDRAPEGEAAIRRKNAAAPLVCRDCEQEMQPEPDEDE